MFLVVVLRMGSYVKIMECMILLIYMKIFFCKVGFYVILVNFIFVKFCSFGVAFRRTVFIVSSLGRLGVDGDVLFIMKVYLWMFLCGLLY